MKIWKIMLIFMIILVFSTIGYANSNERIQVSMNGGKVNVRPVPIIIDGKKTITEIPSFIYVDRTLVPIRFVEDSYGAVVSWEQSTKTATVAYKDKVIKLSIDSAIASINNENKILDKNSIPRLVNFGGTDSRTMVPLSFLSETLGYKVGYDETNKVPFINSKEVITPKDPKPTTPASENIISNIYVDKGSTDSNKLIIKSSKEIAYNTEYLPISNKLVIDITSSRLEMKNTIDAPGKIVVDDKYIEEINYSQFSYNPKITRVVISLKERVKHNISPSSDGTGLLVSFGNNIIKSVKKEIVNGKEAIVVQGTTKFEMNIMNFNDPGRIVIDLMDATLEGDQFFNFDYDLGFVKGVRGSQFSLDNNYSSLDQVVRVVLDIKEGTEEPNIKIDTYDDKIVIYPEKSLWENISYNSEDNHKILNIKNSNETKYTVSNEPGEKWIEITIPAENSNLSQGIVVIKDGLIDEIEVQKDELEVKVLVKFRKSIEFEILSEEIDSEISLLLKRGENLDSKDRLIVIDPGHGGRAIGATSVTGRYEKELNLKLGLKLNEKLEDLGYNTIMTRDTDVDVDLYERARIANSNYADVFISLHGNANNNKSIQGIEVYYWPQNKSDIKEIEQHPFAKAIMEELIKGTNAKDRGIISKPFVVIRETKMPAILVEVGYMSNAEEEKLIFNEKYQEKIIDSIVRGVENYFEMY